MAAKDGDKEVKLSETIRVCEACMIPFSDIFEYCDHLESKEHRKGVMKKKYAKSYLEARAKLDAEKSREKRETSVEVMSESQEKVNKPQNETSKIVEQPVASSINSTEICSSSDEWDTPPICYTCKVCDTICTGEVNYKLHMYGKFHKTNLMNEILLRKLKQQSLIAENDNVPKEDSLYELAFPESQQKCSLECKVCKKTSLDPRQYKQHCKSASHLKKVAVEEELKAKGISLSKGENGDGIEYSCAICIKVFSGCIPFKQHMDSPVHLKQETRMKELGKIKNIFVSNGEDTKLKCKECNKEFSGPCPFNAHLNGSAHRKMKKKIDLMEYLEKNYPEFVKDITDSDDSDDGNIRVGCKVCKMVFSGPEIAKEHFVSYNHQKTLKNKARIKKFKQKQKADKFNEILNGATAKNIVESDSDHSSEIEEGFDIIED